MFATPRLRDFKVQDFYLALCGGRVAGVVGKWDQSAYKQTVVTRYRGRLRVCLRQRKETLPVSAPYAHLFRQM